MALYFKYEDKTGTAFLANGSIGLGSLAVGLGCEPMGIMVGGISLDYNPATGQSNTFGAVLQHLRQSDGLLGTCPENPILLEGKALGQAVALTEKSYIAQPLHRMLQRVSEQASSSRTIPRNPRTFKTLVEWTDFLPDARQRFSELDDTMRRFKPKVVANESKLDDDILSYGQAASCEDDVKANLNKDVLQCVTQVAMARGKGVEFTSAGRGRQLSNTDLLIRKCGVTKHRALSSLILGVVEVKGNWHLKLGPEDDLIAALHDPEKVKGVVSVVQQAFGDAVTDDAPLIIISNYEVTYFLLRDTQNAANKVLKTSPPVPWNSQDPPAMACFLHALELSADLWDAGVKARLSRNEVPGTRVEGFSLQAGEYTFVLNKAFQHGVAIQGPRHSSVPRQSRQMQRRQHCPPQQPQQQGSEHQQQQQGLERQELAAAQQGLQQQQQQGLEFQEQQQQLMGLESQQQQQIVAHQQQEQQAWEQQQQQRHQELAQLCTRSSHIPAGSTVPDTAAAPAQQVDPTSRGSSTDESSSDEGTYTSSVHSLAVSSGSINDSSSVSGYDWQAWAEMAQKPGLSSAIAAVEALPFLLPPQLRYTDEGISISSTSTVVKGHLNSSAIVLKIYNTTTDTQRMFLTESASYIKLADLQGKSIMPLAALGRLPHGGACVLGLSIGQPVPQPVPAGLTESAKAALDNLHKAGYSHGDISAGNMLVFGHRVLLCDLQTCQAAAQQDSFDQDVAELQELLADGDAAEEALV